MTSSTNTVFIIDDDPELCKALRCLLESVALTVFTYPTAEAFLEKFDPSLHGCIILDVRMPGMSGFELQRQLNNFNNHMPIIFLTGHGDVPLAVDAMKAGAMDFMTKPFNAQHFLERVQAAIVLDTKSSENEKTDFLNRLAQLTPREKQIFDCIIAGKLNKQTAAELGISIKTVELHRSNIMQKIKVHSLAETLRLYYKYT